MTLTDWIMIVMILRNLGRIMIVGIKSMIDRILCQGMSDMPVHTLQDLKVVCVERIRPPDPIDHIPLTLMHLQGRLLHRLLLVVPQSLRWS
jgi:hypothetical protein